jgi:hypothetical protein
MAEINWNDIYKNYLTETKDPYKAAEYTVYGRLTGSKKVPKAYTRDEWLVTSAPTYKSLTEYSGNDAASKYLKTQVVPLAKAGKFDLGAVRTIVSTLQKPDGKNYTGPSFGYQEAYDLVKGIYDEVAKAEKSYALQPGSNWWKQYGLPDPSLRFDGTTSKDTGAEQYIANKTAEYSKKLGNDPKKGERVTDFNNALRKALYKKLNDSGVTPFLIAAQKRVKARG